MAQQLVSLHQVLGGQDDIDVIWMVTREPRLLTTDAQQLLRRLMAMKVGVGGGVQHGGDRAEGGRGGVGVIARGCRAEGGGGVGWVQHGSAGQKNKKGALGLIFRQS